MPCRARAHTKQSHINRIHNCTSPFFLPVDAVKNFQLNSCVMRLTEWSKFAHCSIGCTTHLATRNACRCVPRADRTDRHGQQKVNSLPLEHWITLAMRANKELPGTTEGGPFTHRHTHTCAIYAFLDRVRCDVGSFLAYSTDLGDLREISYERITSDEFIKYSRSDCLLAQKMRSSSPNSNRNNQSQQQMPIFASGKTLGINSKWPETKGHETLLENDSN